MSYSSNQIFINISVKNIQKSTDFFKQLGFQFNPMFSDETTSCMIIGENIFAMMMEESRFISFTGKKIPDLHTYSETIYALTAQKKEQVDQIVEKAFSLGATKFSEPIDHGFMYVWGFQDLDGHLWEIAFMDPSQLPQQ